VGELITPEKKKALKPILQANFGKISQREVARRLGLGKTTVNGWNAEMGLRHEKISCNELFFDSWTEDSGYVLGYIYADGNTQNNPGRSRWALTITASEKDVDHLDRVRQLLQVTKPLLYSAKTRSCRMIISNRALVEKLIGIGVNPRKSLVVEFPRIPNVYLRHFIRGVVDGDGSVSYFNRKRSPYFEIRIFSGSRRFLVGASQAIETVTTISANVQHSHGNTYVIRYSSSRGERLGAWLYDDAHIFLERKHQAYVLMKTKRSAKYDQ
jgi:hypothetical protein